MKALLILAAEGYQEKEYGDTRKKLEEGGVEIVIGSSDRKRARGKLGSVTRVDIALNEAHARDYDAIVFIGGPGAVEYQEDKEAHRIAKEAGEKGKVLAAICIAPTILARAGMLRGKKSTVWDDGVGTQADFLEKEGAIYEPKDVVRDGNVITANGPSAANAFGETIIQVLRK